MNDTITLPRATVQQVLEAIDLYQRNEHCEDELLIAGHFLRTALGQQQAKPIGWLDGNDKLAEFMHRDLKAEHDRRGSATPKDFTIPVYTTPPQRKPLTNEQADQIISGLQTCHHQSSKREFLKVWLRDWAAHGIKEGT